MPSKNELLHNISKPKTHYQSLFVYGTLRRDANERACELLDRYADFIDYATYQGLLYKVDDYPGVIPSTDYADRVLGEVYRLHQPHVVLSRLDVYEECSTHFPRPTEYLRDIQYVRLFSGEMIPAWIYLYNHPTHKLERIASGDFLSLQDYVI